MWWSRLEINGKVHQFTTHCKVKNEARSFEAARRTELIKGLVGLTSPTLNAFSERFLNSLPGRVGRGTFRFYVNFWKSLLAFQPLRDCRLDRINMAIVEDFVQWRQKDELSPTTINHSLRTLRRALHLALEWDLIRRVPKIKLLAGEHQRDYVITPEVEKQFATEGSGPMSWIVPFLCDTGLRRSELSGLTWVDINFREKYVFISKGKSKFARRKIPFTTKVEKLLLSLKEKAPEGNPHVFLYYGRRNRDYARRMTKDYLSHAFLRARKKLKLPEECVLHSTRHTFCTRLGERGADAFAIQRLAGHSSILISQRYVHPSAGKLDAAIALLEDSNA